MIKFETDWSLNERVIDVNVESLIKKSNFYSNELKLTMKLFLFE